MMEIIDATFSTRKDPDQLQVSKKDIDKLHQIHPACLSEFTYQGGPGIWILLIPTTQNVMNNFLEKRISERQILENTQPGETYSCLYLCSATTLPELRGKGLTKNLCLGSIAEIMKNHPINTLFVWAFTKEGEILADAIAKKTDLQLKKAKF